MANLKVSKVLALPTVLTPSTLYLVKASSSTFSMYLTDATGTIAYRSPDSSDVSAIILAIINALKDQPGGLAGLDLNGQLLVPVIASGIDGQTADLRSNGDYIWKDLLAPFTETSGVSSGNRPTYGNIMGNLRGLLFDRNTMQQVWVDFHIGHDIALDTRIYPHIHWCPTDQAAGTVRWGIEYYIAKGHGQQIFSNPVTVYVSHTFTTNNQWRHMVTEVSDLQAILSTDVEPDTVIKCRVFRDASSSIDTYNTNIHAWQADLHYQAASTGTRHRSPNFYTP